MFSALAHPLRLGALYVLHEDGGCTHGDLADALATEGNGLNHHLNAVVDTPLVRKTPSNEDGRKMIYRLTPVGTRVTEYVLDMMAAEREAVETDYLDSDTDT
jgi:DNA-binding MarR family transcriptional regulator